MRSNDTIKSCLKKPGSVKSNQSKVRFNMHEFSQYEEDEKIEFNKRKYKMIGGPPDPG